MEAYKEVQKFNQLWIWLPLATTSIISFVLLFTIPGDTWDSRIAAILIVAFVILLLTTLRLKTRIDEKGVSFTYPPFMRKGRSFSWDEIQLAYTRKYNPLLEYGGWGYKGRKGNKAFNVSGSEGLQLEFKDGTKVLIGSQNIKGINQYLTYLKEKHQLQSIQLI